MNLIRAKEISIIFQEPMTSLNPVYTVGDQIAEVIALHQNLRRRQAMEGAAEMLRLVNIPNPQRRVHDYPHQFSGGMRQRVMIAMALSCSPKLLIADEPTTALDVTVQAQIVDLVKTLVKDIGASVIWISHDLGLVANLCDRVNVMYAGRIVESGPVRDVFYRPSHGYTLGLMSCTPRIDLVGERLHPIEGLPPDLRQSIALCPFLPRCSYSIDRCRTERPALLEERPAHWASCFADLTASWRQTT
ncbi:MAG: ABC transporter ATP-binding protein, partial [Bradyrhizobium sp.]